MSDEITHTKYTNAPGIKITMMNAQGYEEEYDAAEILRRAYKWFGVKAPSKYTFALRDDYYKTMKAYSAWVRQDKKDNEDWWAEWKV